MKTSELTGAMLDYWVAMAGKEWANAHDYYPTLTLDPTFNGVTLGMFPRGAYGSMVETCILQPSNPFRQDPAPFCPSIWWAHGGPIIQREQIDIAAPTEFDDDERWFAGIYHGAARRATPRNCEMRGETPLIAAMRAYVASRFGAEVPDLPAKEG